MKQGIAVLIFLWATLVALPAFAAYVISLKRGLPTDIWLTWPEKDRLDEPELIAVFPEYRQEYKGTEFAMAKRAGFDFIRLTVDPAVFLTKRNPKKTSQLLKGVRIAIDEILGAGLKVDVDMHSIPRDDGAPGTKQIMSDNALFSEYLKVLHDVGKAIADYPVDKVAFELFNEPTGDCAWDLGEGQTSSWPLKLAKLHDAARISAPKMTLVLSGACWGGAEGLVALDPKLITDQNVIWSFHNYEPFIFTHQGASWNDGHERYMSGLHFPPDPKQKKAILAASLQAIGKADLPVSKRKELQANARHDIDAYFKPDWAMTKAKEAFVKVEDWAKVYSVPASRILLGEFGAIRPENFDALKEKERAGYYKLIRDEAEKLGYAWSTWEWKAGFGLSKKFDGREFDPAMLAALGLRE